MTDDEEKFRRIAARNSGHASAEIENDIEAATAETRQYGTRNIDLLMAYYNDPDTDAGEWPDFKPFTLSRADSRLPAGFARRSTVIRMAALLLGLCIITGAAAFVAATGGGAGWAVSVFGVLLAVFGLGVVAGRKS